MTVVCSALEEGLSQALNDATVYLAFDDERVYLDPAVVNCGIFQYFDFTCLGVDLDYTHVRSERPREVWRVIGDLSFEVRFDTVREIMSGECLEGDSGKRHFLVGRAGNAEHATGELEVVGARFHLVSGDLLCLLDDLIARHPDRNAAYGKRS